MPENESLNNLLRKGDPAGNPASSQTSEERYTLLVPRLTENSQPVKLVGKRRGAWLAVPALALAAVAVALVGRPSAPPAPVPSATPDMIVLASPTPLPIIKPTPTAPEKKLATQKVSTPELRKPQRLYRKKWQVAESQRPRRKYRPHVRRHVRPVESTEPTNTIETNANVERVVIEGTGEPTSRVAIVITGKGENLSVTKALLEEKS